MDTGPVNYDRRVMRVDANDLDGYYDARPADSNLTTVQNNMYIRGVQALENQTRVSISRADVANLSQYEFRKDYNLGDLVSLDGNFGQIAKMRVVEYVEIEDENGYSGHPTLELPLTPTTTYPPGGGGPSPGLEKVPLPSPPFTTIPVEEEGKSE